METTDKIFTTDGGNSFANGAMMGASLNRNNDPAMAAMMNGGMNGQWNNPFVYLVWMMFANRWMGNYGNPTAANTPHRHRFKPCKVLCRTTTTLTC